jgi:ABC-2 type transport system permease protein
MTGTWTLLAMALRRDRVLLPAWLLVFVAVAASSASATEGLYPTVESRVRAAEGVNATPALVALYGPVYDVGSLGAVAFFKLIVFGGALVAVFAMLLVVRHTRADEEVGRTELVVAGAVGRHAPLLAGVLLAGVATVSVGLFTALGIAAGGLDPAGAAALGATWAGAGLAFLGVGALAAQVTTSARTARGIAVTVLVTAYAVRAAADSGGGAWLTWVTPMGWVQELRPFAGNRWWVLLLLAGFGLLATAAAVLVAARRDLGEGILPDRAGPGRGALAGTDGLAWRLHRQALLGWTIGFLLLGLLLGSMVTQLGDFLDTPEALDMIRRLGGTRVLTDAFLSAELGVLALFAAGFGLSTTTRMHAEEVSGRVESLMATGTGRVRWMAGHLAMAFLGTALLLVAVGFAVGVGHALQGGAPGDVPRDLGAAVVRLPAVWVVVGAAALLHGLASRLALQGWTVLVGCLVLGEFGTLMDLPGWARDLSPFTHVPALPGQPFALAPVLALLALAAALTAAGLLLFRRRDLQVD